MSNTVDWIWYGEDAEGDAVISFGRWAKHPCQNRYKLADIQPTEHDHPLTAQQDGAWQPIETAPKDRQVLAIENFEREDEEGRKYPKDRQVVSWSSAAEAWVSFGIALSSFEPTHWRPLPADPEQAGER